MQVRDTGRSRPSLSPAQAQNQQGVQMMKQALAQDATVLQVVSAATQASGAPAPIMPTTGGMGMHVNILI